MSGENYGTDLVDIGCPYCGESIDLVVDLSEPHQEYIEDCSVCCRPISLTIAVSEDGANVIARHENE